ncbi:MAG: amidase family protein, partial [Candidatus Micrarchaeia archaeon]
MSEIDIDEKLEQVLNTIRKVDPEIKAYVEIFDIDAKNRVKEIKEKIERGCAGKLAGMLMAVKNNIAIKGKRLTCSSKILENYYSPYNATVIEKLEKEDAIIIGTTNMDEFACGSDTTHSALHWTRNPRDPQRVPGGSSGGSAAAVAANMCDAALGSDTGGSIRCPAAFCGVIGFKPTYGAVSRYGLVDAAMSLDQIGPIARDVTVVERIFNVIKGKDEKDPITYRYEEKKSKVKTIGIPKEFFNGTDERIVAATEKVISRLEKEYEIIEVSLPSIKYAIPTYYLLMFAEFSSAMQRYDGLRYGTMADRMKELYQSFAEIRGTNFGK